MSSSDSISHTKDASSASEVSAYEQPQGRFKRAVEPIRRKMEFSRSYNVPIWIILSGCMIGFVLSRFPYYYEPYMDSHEVPANIYWYSQKGSVSRIGFFMHLAGVLPAGFLACFQFIPWIRHHYIIVHRITGYLAIFLLYFGSIGAYMIAPTSLGGTLIWQAGVYTMGIIIMVSLFMAWINIKRLQIDKHREWMIRAWIISGAIVSLRPLNALMVYGFAKYPSLKFHSTFSCAELLFMTNGDNSLIPQCDPTQSIKFLSSIFVGIRADANTPLGLNALARYTFPTGAWVVVSTHLIFAEIYLHLTSSESDRLRKISYKKQLEKGMKHPGSAGTVADRMGDAKKWYPNGYRGLDTNSEAKV